MQIWGESKHTCNRDIKAGVLSAQLPQQWGHLCDCTHVCLSLHTCSTKFLSCFMIIIRETEKPMMCSEVQGYGGELGATL